MEFRPIVLGGLSMGSLVVLCSIEEGGVEMALFGSKELAQFGVD